MFLESQVSQSSQDTLLEKREPHRAGMREICRGSPYPSPKSEFCKFYCGGVLGACVYYAIIQLQKCFNFNYDFFCGSWSLNGHFVISLSHLLSKLTFFQLISPLWSPNMITNLLNLFFFLTPFFGRLFYILPLFFYGYP